MPRLDASKGAALLVIGSDYRGPETGPARGPHGIRITAGAHCPVAVVPDLDLTGRTGVVVGIDGADVSEAAIAFAAAEADRSAEVLTAVSAWSPVTVPLGLRSYPDDYLGIMHRMAAETLACSVGGLPSKYPDLGLELVVERGEPALLINRVAAHAPGVPRGGGLSGPRRRDRDGVSHRAMVSENDQELTQKDDTARWLLTSLPSSSCSGN